MAKGDNYTGGFGVTYNAPTKGEGGGLPPINQLPQYYDAQQRAIQATRSPGGVGSLYQSQAYLPALAQSRFAAAPTWYNQQTGASFGEGTPQDYFRNYITNALIPYLDPSTQASTASYLSRAAPSYGSYTGAAEQPIATSLTPYQVREFTSRARLNEVANALGSSGGAAGIIAALPGSEQAKFAPQIGIYDPNSEEEIARRRTASDKGQNRQGGQPAQNKGYVPETIAGVGIGGQFSKDIADTNASLGWLTNALRTAAMGGTGSTRTEQQYARKHLGTLYEEAEQDPNRVGQYRTIFENLTNPVGSKAPTSGVLGFSRNLQNTPEFTRKGFGLRNPFLT